MTLVFLAIVLAITGTSRSVLVQKPDDVLHIDGKKNPEMIPEWAAWEDALRIINGGSRQLPSDVLIHTKKPEEELILRESDGQRKRDADCKARLLALTPGSDKPDVLTEKKQAIRLECRRQALHARDRILAAVSPEVRTAVLEFVDSVKRATRVDILRRDLAFFLQPQ